MTEPTQPPDRPDSASDSDTGRAQDRHRRSEPACEPFPVHGTAFDIALWQVRHKHDGTPRRAFDTGTDPE